MTAVPDGAIIATSLLDTSWALVLGPLFRAGEGSVLEQAIALAYRPGTWSWHDRVRGGGPGHGQDRGPRVDAVLPEADVAMSMAKARGKSRFELATTSASA